MTAPASARSASTSTRASGQVGADGLDHRGAVAVGQGPVDDDHVGREGGHGDSRLGDAVGRTDGLDARLCGEHVDEAVGNHALVVDHQNLHGAENS